MRFAIASSQVCTPAGIVEAVIIVDGETIESVVPFEEFDGSIACEHFGDQMISPGVVDTHVHINEPGRTDWEGFETATMAAAAGGVTTLIDMPLNSSPVTTSLSALQSKRSAASGKCHVDVGFYGGLVPDQLDSVDDLLNAGVFGIKAFMCDSGLAEFPATNESHFRSVLPRLADANVPLLVHAEVADASRIETVSDNCCYFEYVKSRPDAWELKAIDILIRLCREFMAPMHVVHVATDESEYLISSAKQHELPITFETCPHYLFFESESIELGDTRFKCAPPIRSRRNRKNLWAMFTSGLLDTIGSDHSPCLPALKDLESGRFTHAWGGIAGLQFSLAVMATLCQQYRFPLDSLAKRMSAQPAEIIGLGNRKGQLASGYDADIIVWDPGASWVVTKDKILHRHKITPYENQKLYGVVERTYVRGKLVFQNGELIGEPSGILLERE